MAVRSMYLTAMTQNSHSKQPGCISCLSGERGVDSPERAIAVGALLISEKAARFCGFSASLRLGPINILYPFKSRFAVRGLVRPTASRTSDWPLLVLSPL